MTFHLDVRIAAPPSTVFAFVADFTTMPRWYSAVQRVEPMEGSGGLGGRYRIHRDLPGGPATNVVTVSELVDGEAVEFTSVSGPTPFVYRYGIHPSGAGTLLSLDGRISGEGLRGPAVLGAFAETLFARGMRDNLRDLTHILER